MQRVIDDCLVARIDCNNGAFPPLPGESRIREMVGPNVFAITPGRFLPGGPVSGNQPVTAISPLNPNPGATPTPSPSPSPTPPPDDSNDDNDTPASPSDDDDYEDDNSDDNDDSGQSYTEVNGFQFRNVAPGYINWQVDGFYQSENGIVAVLFGPNPGITIGTNGVTSYARAYNETDVYVPFDQAHYLRLCHTDRSALTCSSYSEEIYVPSL